MLHFRRSSEPARSALKSHPPKDISDPNSSTKEGSHHATLQTRSREFFGTFWLVFGGCGSAVLAAAFPQLGIGFVGVAFAFGLTVLTMAFAIGHISGCHLNPAVSVGLVVAKRFPVPS